MTEAALRERGRFHLLKINHALRGAAQRELFFLRLLACDEATDEVDDAPECGPLSI